MEGALHFLEMYPGQVENVRVKNNDGRNAVITWAERKPQPSRYAVRWWNIDRGDVFEESATRLNYFVFNQLKPGTTIAVKVAAENSSGRGEFSDVVRIESAPRSPTHIFVSNNLRFEDPSLSVFIDDPDPVTKTYIVTATSIEKDRHIREVETEQRRVHIRDLHPNSNYEVTVTASKGDLRSLPTRFDKEILTVPGKIRGLSHKQLSSRTCEVCWEDEIAVVTYDIQWGVPGAAVKNETSDVSHIILKDLELGSQYYVRVVARNQSGPGLFSDIYKFETDPPLAVPQNVSVTINKANPESALDICFDEPSPAHKNYKVIAWSNGKKVQSKVISDSSTTVGGLQPGREYIIFIHAGDRDTTYSDMAKSSSIWTVPEKIGQITSSRESRTTHLLKWGEVEGASSYMIEWRKIGRTVANSDTTESTRFILGDLEAGEEYSVQICGKNSSGRGRFSEKFNFRTAMKAPNHIQVSLNKQNHESLDVEFDEPQPTAKQYRVKVRNLRGRVPDVEKITETGFVSIGGLFHGESYRVYVTSEDGEDSSLTSEETESAEILTYPKAVENISVDISSDNHYTLKWDRVKSAENYQISYKTEGDDFVSHETKQPHFVLLDLPTSDDCTVRIRGENSSGWGEYSQEKTFKTALSPPNNICVIPEAGPNGTVRVTFDPAPGADRYKAKAKPDHGTEGIVETITEETSLRLHGLLPEKKYKVIVQSISSKDENLTSIEANSDEFYPRLPKISKPVVTQLQSEEWKISWANQLGTDSYRIQWGIENQERNEKMVTGKNQLILSKAEPGSNYEVEIVPISNGVEQEQSDSEKFTTVPSAPEGLKYDLLSTEKVQFSCNATKGATKYEFQISFEKDRKDELTSEITVETEKPECTVKVSFEEIFATVRAANGGGWSKPSTPLKFRHVIRLVKKMFKKKAADAMPSDTFVKPLLVGELRATKLDAEASIAKPGETATIYGPLFSGKTSLCHHLIQSQSACEIGIFLDFLNHTDSNEEVKFTEFLQSVMPDLTSEEIESLMKWMRGNQELVLFVVDNVTVTRDFETPKNKSKDIPKNLIYRLLKPRRNILPKSRVVCTTAQSKLFTMIDSANPMKLLGFDQRGKREMWKIVGQKRPEIDFSHLEVFFCSPGLFDVIVRLANEGKLTDFFSKTAVLIDVFTEIMNNISQTSKNASLEALKQELQHLEVEEKDSIRTGKARKIKRKSSGRAGSAITSPRMASQFGASETTDSIWLHELFLNALKAALVSESTDFQKAFINETGLEMQHSECFKISAGLLREDTTRKARRLLSNDIILAENAVIEKKREALKQFISKNSDKIRSAYSFNCKITLDWMDCCMELGDRELLTKCSPHIKVKHDTPDETLRQIETFLRSPSSASGKTRVSFKNDLEPPKRLDIETSIRQNPLGEAIVLDEYKKGKLGSRKSQGQYSIASRFSASSLETARVATNESFAAEDNQHIGPSYEGSSAGSIKTLTDTQAEIASHECDVGSIKTEEERECTVSPTNEGKIEGVKAEIVPDGIRVEWEEKEKDSSYEVRLFFEGKDVEEMTQSTKQLQHVFKSHTHGHRYFCTVTAISEDGHPIGTEKSNIVGNLQDNREYFRNGSKR